jgi:trk system potassium uptake protein TrkA
MEITSLNSWWGKTISELDLRSKYGINIVALKRGVKIDVSPNPDEEILEGDILLIIGNTNDLIKIENKAGE